MLIPNGWCGMHPAAGSQGIPNPNGKCGGGGVGGGGDGLGGRDGGGFGKMGGTGGGGLGDAGGGSGGGGGTGGAKFCSVLESSVSGTISEKSPVCCVYSVPL